MAAEPIEGWSRAPSAHRRWAALDGVRGLAALAFVAGSFDVPGLAGGWVGLEVLFVVAGFSMTRWLLEDSPGERRVAPFMLRRIVLVLPVVVAVVSFALVWSYVQDGTFTPAVRGAAAASVAQLYDVAAVFGEVDARAFAAMWAVSLEFQFSIVAVVLVAVLGGRDARRSAGIVALLACAASMVRMAAIGAGGEPADVMVLPWFRVDGLLFGAAAAFVHRRVVVDERQRLYRWTVPVLVGLAVSVVILPRWSSWRVPSLVVAIPTISILAAVAVVAITTRSAPAVVVRLLAWPGFRALGRRSLGLYLWHHPIGVMLVAGGVEGWQGSGLLLRQVALTVVVVLASHEFLERPARAFLLRRLKRP